MADPALKPLHALGGEASHVAVIEGLSIRENADVAMASAAARVGRDKDLAKAAKKLVGFDLPGPGEMASRGDWAALWTSPGQWMITAPFADHEDIARIVKAGLGDSASVTEQTDGWVRFEVEGARTADLFERLCNVDIRILRAGQATRCQIEHLGAFVLCHTAGRAFSVITLRSAAASMHHALVTAAKSLP